VVAGVVGLLCLAGQSNAPAIRPNGESKEGRHLQVQQQLLKVGDAHTNHHPAEEKAKQRRRHLATSMRSMRIVMIQLKVVLSATCQDINDAPSCSKNLKEVPVFFPRPKVLWTW
jgi:hypothetical protein